jgi:uncharacterized protein
MSDEFEVSWPLDGMTMYGSVTRPSGGGPFPGVVLVAGSGPTDRNWNSPLLPGDNGSGRLIARTLANAGIACLRYDKRASGPDVAENLLALIGHISMQSHLDELTAAVGVLAGQDFVDSSRLVGLGNSEGCLHVLHYATSQQEVALIGLVLLSPPGRAVGELLISQLSLQLAQVPGGSTLLPLVEAAAARYSAGRSMDPDPSLPEPIRMVLESFETPANLPFARELWSEDACDTLPSVLLPTLVVIGGKDAQVDAEVDGQRLQHAAAGHANVTFAFPPNANHVLKEEPRSIAEVAASGNARYSDPETHLDPEAVGIVRSWLEDLLASD